MRRALQYDATHRLETFKILFVSKCSSEVFCYFSEEIGFPTFKGNCSMLVVLIGQVHVVQNMSLRRMILLLYVNRTIAPTIRELDVLVSKETWAHLLCPTMCHQAETAWLRSRKDCGFDEILFKKKFKPLVFKSHLSFDSQRRAQTKNLSLTLTSVFELPKH